MKDHEVMSIDSGVRTSSNDCFDEFGEEISGDESNGSLIKPKLSSSIKLSPKSLFSKSDKKNSWKNSI